MRARLAVVAAAGSVLLVGSAAGAPSPGTIVTLAQLAHPRGLAVMPDGSVLVAEPFASDVRKVLPDGTVTTVAGTGTAGFAGDGGPATAAELDQPHGVALLPDGSFVIADALNNRIRRVLPDGTIVTMVGTGGHGFSGDGGPAADAEIASPRGVASLPDGTLLIPDSDNNRIRLVAPDGTISTVAGDGVAGFSGDGGPGTAAELDHPHAVLPLAKGFLVADTLNDRVRRVWPDGTITTVAGDGTAGFSGDGGTPVSAELDQPKALALRPDGRVLVADAVNDRLRLLTLPAVAPPRVVTFRVVRTRPLLDLRFRVCDGSRDVLGAELRVTSGGSTTVRTAVLLSTHGGCRPYRLLVKAGRVLPRLRLRVRDDRGLWSNNVRIARA